MEIISPEKLKKMEREDKFQLLFQLREEYEDNYQMMVARAGTKDNIKFVKEEENLYMMERRIRDAIGPPYSGYKTDICPAGSTQDCRECSGFLLKGPKKYKLVKKYVKGVELCQYRKK